MISVKKNIQGSALLVALFVIVIMTLLGTAIVKMQTTSSEAIAQEVLGTRALAAARTGMQVQLQKLFPQKGVTPYCPSTASSIPNLDTITGLQQCTVSTTCQLYAEHDGIKYYRLRSTGECGSGNLASDSKNIVISSRTIQVEARNL